MHIVGGEGSEEEAEGGEREGKKAGTAGRPEGDPKSTLARSVADISQSAAEAGLGVDPLFHKM